jgi:thiol-disulfide isomerase/thioredoxin
MKPSVAQPSALPLLGDVARLRRQDRLTEGVALVEAALREAHATPFDVAFRDRVQLGLSLADLYLETDQAERANDLLSTEVTFAERMFAQTARAGTPDQARAASAGRWQLRDRATQVALLGRPAPEIGALDWVFGEGDTHADRPGTVAMLEFWASWCPPCLTMLPMLRGLHDRYARDGLTILALTRYRSAQAAHRVSEREAIAQIAADSCPGVAVGIASDVGLQQRYGAMGIPAFALIDRNGIVRCTSSTPDETEVERLVVDLLHAPTRS